MSVYIPDPITGAIREVRGVLEWASAPPPVPPVVPARDDLPIMPPMASASQDGFAVSLEVGSAGQGEYAEGGVVARAWKMFNRILSNAWQDGFSTLAQIVFGTPSTYARVVMQLAAAKPVYSFAFTVRSDLACLMTSFTLCGWDGSAWVALSSYVNVDYTATNSTTNTNGQKTQVFQTTTQGVYGRYSVLFTGSGALGQIIEAQFFS